MVLEIQIDPSQWLVEESTWDRVGPFYEANPVVGRGAAFTHAWGASHGSFSYAFSLPPGAWTKATVSARLSSEHPWYSSPPNYFSDVALGVNEWSYPSKRVIPDNGSGIVYLWFVNPNRLREGFNKLTLLVKRNAPYRNGLCIYHRAVIPDERDHPIAVMVESE
jgi:hypothetical protein